MVEAGYVFATARPGGFAGERERLALGEALWDPGTERRLAELGVGAGWSCLEVGAGLGSVARWLAGRTGQVTAVDLDASRLRWLNRHGVEVRSLDVTADDLPAERYDLVHARLVVQHVADRERVVRRLCRALRPGGLLVLEDTDTASLFSHPDGPFLVAVKEAAYRVMRAAGHHPRCGLLDVELARAAGLAQVRADGRAEVVRGGSPASRWYALWLEHLRPGIVADRQVSAADLDAALAALADPVNVWLSQVMITVTGRKASTP